MTRLTLIALVLLAFACDTTNVYAPKCDKHDHDKHDDWKRIGAFQGDTPFDYVPFPKTSPGKTDDPPRLPKPLDQGCGDNR